LEISLKNKHKKNEIINFIKEFISLSKENEKVSNFSWYFFIPSKYASESAFINLHYRLKENTIGMGLTIKIEKEDKDKDKDDIQNKVFTIAKEEKEYEFELTLKKMKQLIKSLEEERDKEEEEECAFRFEFNEKQLIVSSKKRFITINKVAENPTDWSSFPTSYHIDQKVSFVKKELEILMDLIEGYSSNIIIQFKKFRVIFTEKKDKLNLEKRIEFSAEDFEREGREPIIKEEREVKYNINRLFFCLRRILKYKSYRAKVILNEGIEFPRFDLIHSELYSKIKRYIHMVR
jgi:hypothetical protein